MYLQMGSDFDLVKGAVNVGSRFVKAAGTEAGNNVLRKVVGALSQSVLEDRASKIKQQIHEKRFDPFDDEYDAKAETEEKKPDPLKFIKENFALGDAISLGGLAMLFLENTINKGQEKLGFFQSSLKILVLFLQLEEVQQLL